MRSRLVMPAFVGGLVIGVLSALPVISVGNVCCCLWVVVGGAVGAYLLQQNQTAPITAGDGALVGALAGLIGAFVSLVLSIPITLLMSPVQRAVLERLRDSGASMPPEVTQAFDNAGSGFLLVASFLLMLFISPVFAATGGLLGAMIFRKPLPPPLPPPTPGGPSTPIDVPYSPG